MSLREFLGEVRIVDPKDVKIVCDERRNSLKIFIRDEIYYNVLPKKPFPFTRPYFIIFTTRRGEEICVLKDYRGLDKDSIKNLEYMLSKMYYIPLIKDIEKISYSSGTYRWSVLTDRGRREFETRGRRSIVKLSDGRIIVFDIDENVYEIRPWLLDRKSIEYLDLVI